MTNMTNLDDKDDKKDVIETVDMPFFWRSSRAGQGLLFSLFAGIVGVNLFADLPLGLNVLCFALLALFGFMAMRYFTRSATQKKFSKKELGLVGLTLFFVASLVWRESMVLNSLSIISLMLLGIMAFGIGKQRQWNAWTLRDSGRDSLGVASYVATTPIRLGRGSYQETLSLLQRLCDQQTSEAVVRGLMFATPIMVIFSLLLMQADARFESTITHLFNWDLSALWSNTGLFVLCFVLAAILQRAAGALAPTIVTKEATNASESVSEKDDTEGTTKKSYRIETGIVLTLVNVLFLSFVWVQFSYFFGGDTMIQEATGPSYSEYARRGFFQLLIVTLLVMLLLLSSYAIFKPTNIRQLRWFQVLAGSMIVLTWIIELSAVHRMAIYVQAYGLTELRFYSSVMMAWIAIVLLWFSLSILRNRAGLFMFGAVISLFLSVALLYVVNPDATIMRTNMDRLVAGEHFDSKYLEHLSADAIPVVAQRLPVLHQNEHYKGMACVLSAVLMALTHSTTAEKQADQHWLAWHLARDQRDQAMAEYQVIACH